MEVFVLIVFGNRLITKIQGAVFICPSPALYVLKLNELVNGTIDEETGERVAACVIKYAMSDNVRRSGEINSHSVVREFCSHFNSFWLAQFQH